MNNKIDINNIHTNTDITEEMAEAATLLHSMQCRSNHTDQCGWEYGIRRKATDNHQPLEKITNFDNYDHDWSEYDHANYLIKAITALNSGVTVEQIALIRQALNTHTYQQSKELTRRLHNSHATQEN